MKSVIPKSETQILCEQVEKMIGIKPKDHYNKARLHKRIAHATSFAKESINNRVYYKN